MNTHWLDQMGMNFVNERRHFNIKIQTLRHPLRAN